MLLVASMLWACSGGLIGDGDIDKGADSVAAVDSGPETQASDVVNGDDLPDGVAADVPPDADSLVTDEGPGTDEAPGDATTTDTPLPTSCNNDDDCGTDRHCCTSMFGSGTCYPADKECPGGMSNCIDDDDCGGSGNVCCDFFGAAKMCMPESMCPGTPGGCTTDDDCKTPGQVCCKFGDMAQTPTCMSDAMCPKDCKTDADCPSHQECCDLNDTVVCLDKGQCPEKCLHSTTECPLGQECCDAGDGLLVCVSAAECPGSITCAGPTDVCVNSRGEPNGFTCCEVPELGFRCVGSGGCDDWGACEVDADCPVGRECCELEAGLTCVPTGACPIQGHQLPPCEAHDDCTTDGDVCCIVPGSDTGCAPAAQCPSQCLTDDDCGTGICCIRQDNPASCQSPAQCEMGKPCNGPDDCMEGNECCEMGGSKSCMPQGQCIGQSCDKDQDCPEGSKCCSVFGQKMCFPGNCPM
jgi:hypothetical protein